MSTVASEFPKQQARCRELLEVYREIGPAGAFGAAVIERTLREADEALASGDVVAMVRVFAKMRDHQ